MNTAAIITSLMENRFHPAGGLRQIFLVACGGSLVDMYPAHYFLNCESATLHSFMMTANEFVHAAPKTLGKNSLTIVCSHGGNTPESVAAAKLAQQHGSTTITLTHNAEAELIAWSDSNILYAWGNDSQVVANPMALILNLCVEALAQSEGFSGYADFQSGMAQIDGVIARARMQVQQRCAEFADRYRNESLFYVLSSGASYGHAYGFAICSLMEMQWLNAASIHSGEFFHGPFEVTNRNTPWIVMVNEGRTRPLDERAVHFLAQYGDKVEIVDAKELGLSVIPAPVVDYFNPVLFYSVMCEYRAALALVRQHPLETRRYMGKVAY
ncbi:SIS domain-containing protein [Brenneria goodwinii]|uniref:SIS domain-containing protein n=1 Tax=Brenneria goodwinii TaxID=1109412 RepID=UPI000EF24985|nr:SIS domain-containing protein [Brenneria goodwinii]MCG8157321.1 SIS domain-containing protein [Brenneria goodwinii]MCG8163356.1 SIS domain-containing protein [Brenneria goodwinii]MCG8165135.1 SIS domain-containing protein [Brenneria goodwinii]MCG8170897.1 SIS domain-containing protein [Brenneria goodwinii]MCG8175902.1 SIS domain-containing protein [Brenneria goodwinii]